MSGALPLQAELARCLTEEDLEPGLGHQGVIVPNTPTQDHDHTVHVGVLVEEAVAVTMEDTVIVERNSTVVIHAVPCPTDAGTSATE